MSKFAKGVVFALAGAACWGFSGTCAQYLGMRCTISPVFIVMVRNVGAAVVFGVLLAVRYRAQTREMLSDRSCWGAFFAFAVVGVCTCQTCYIFTINMTNAGTATVLQSLNVVMVLLWMCVKCRRGPRLFECAGVCLALVSTFLIATGGDPASMNIPVEGLVGGLVTAAAVAVYVLAPRPLFERWDSLPVVAAGMVVAGAFSGVVWCAGALLCAGAPALAPVFSVPALGADGAAALAAMLLVGTIVAFALYLYGVAIVGGVTGSLLGTMEPVTASVLAAAWLGTSFSLADWAGLVLMMAMIFLVALQPSESPSARKLARRTRRGKRRE